ncbi:oxidoreductase domain protein [Paenibacillus curdlanolyticus YK9]|uniref:Oxidoreductase domain protein n=1 Tax=Paenibacillus curdlanolyticus YK9 TaxID=717606 RepID=E0I9P3_9BACL|nr:oxidoreductase [Paenibacillus curdlanolyticus]EFM11127.1 oxidoreductase domain protein [Paenibacillus curdlanolyticus YK9]
MKINVGLVGYGLSGSVFHAPIIHGVEGMHLQAVVSSDAAKVNKDYPEVHVFADIDALVAQSEIDLVVICSPNTTHYAYAKKAILAGKHVVAEKPFTVDTNEANELIALAREHKVQLAVYQNRRWDNDFLTIQSLLETGMLGRLSTYEAHFDRYRPEVRNRWREQNLPGSGILYDLGSHLIDQALYLFGKPQTVWADIRTERDGGQSDDYFHLILGYPQLRVILHSGSLVKLAGPRYMLHGDKGSFVKYGLDPQEDQLKAGKHPGDSGWGEDLPELYGKLSTEVGGLPMEAIIGTLPGKYEAFYEGMAAAIRSGEAVPVSGEQARDTIRIIECAVQSHREQRTIQLEAQ